jgi:hypothetical protein
MAPWISTQHGHDITLTGDLSGNIIDINDIAHSLARINRFTGHTTHTWSVAQHSALVMAMGWNLTIPEQLCLLMHDAHEAYLGDVPSPIKAALGDTWRKLEKAHEDAVHHEFGLRSAMATHRAVIKSLDLAALRLERFWLLGEQGNRKPWPVIDGDDKRWSLPRLCELQLVKHIHQLTPTPDHAADFFLTNFQQRIGTLQ